MARGLKIAHKQDNGTLSDQRITGSAVGTSNYFGGVGGIPQWVTSTGVKTIKVQFRTATGVLHANAYIIRQKGSEQFLVANAVGAVNGATHSNASVTVCTLAAGTDAANSAPAAGASTCTITGYTTSNTAFYASRITTKHVYDQSNVKMRYKHNSQVATSSFANVNTH
jgi:hypothetical protein